MQKHVLGVNRRLIPLYCAIYFTFNDIYKYIYINNILLKHYFSNTLKTI